VEHQGRAEVRVPCAVVPGISEAVDRVGVERAARELRSEGSWRSRPALEL